MAKGQKRSNREAKKPKKEKLKVIAAAPGNSWVTVDQMKSRTANAKDKK